MLVNEDHETSQAQSEILHPFSRSLFRFWEATRGASAAPARADIDLKAIREMVPYLLLIARDHRTGSFMWRLAGTKICDLYRHELTGCDALAGWDGFESEVVGRFLAGVIDGLQPCLLRIRLRTDLGQLIGAEILGLPVVAADGGKIQIFGGVFPFRETQALTYQHISGMELSGARTIWTEHLPGDALVKQLEINDNRPYRPFQMIPGGRL
jgi:hypothetical protein